MPKNKTVFKEGASYLLSSGENTGPMKQVQAFPNGGQLHTPNQNWYSEKLDWYFWPSGRDTGCNRKVVSTIKENLDEN